jgi:hypothetical protein
MLPADGRQSPAALAIQRGLGRLLRSYGLAPVPEVPLPNGRRADMAALDAKGTIWIIEIKSSLIDFQTDIKWPAYLDHCDRLFFAVNPDFPIEVLPAETGLMICDAYGGALVRDAPEIRLPAPARKAMTLLMARLAAARLHQAMDPGGAIAFDGT